MGTRQVTIRFCDCCSKEIVGRLTSHTCPCCGKDICVSCQEKEDSKHKPGEKKRKAARTQSQIETPPSEEAATKEGPEIVDKKGDNLVIHVPTREGKDTEYLVNIAGSESKGATLKLTVEKALEEFAGKIPGCLSDEERQTIQGILDA